MIINIFKQVKFDFYHAKFNKTKEIWLRVWQRGWLPVLWCLGLYRTLRDCTGLHWAVMDCTGLCWSVLGCTLYNVHSLRCLSLSGKLLYGARTIWYSIEMSILWTNITFSKGMSVLKFSILWLWKKHFLLWKFQVVIMCISAGVSASWPALKRNGIDTAARYCCRYCSTVDTAARYTGLLIFWNTRHVVCEQTIKFDTSRRLPWSSSLLVYQSTTSTWSIWSLWSGSYLWLSHRHSISFTGRVYHHFEIC